LYKTRPQFPKEKFERMLRDDLTGIRSERYETRPHSYWKIFAPDWFGRIAEKHLRTMFQKGYFKELSWNDLFHGHIIFAEDAAIGPYDNLNDFLHAVSLIVYHADENTFRWRKEVCKPADGRKQRSIAAYSTGEIVPAIGLVNEELLQNYKQFGTVYDTDIIFEHPTLFKNTWDIDERINIKSPQCAPAFQFFIKPYRHGRYRAGPYALDVFFKCTVNDTSMHQ